MTCVAAVIALITRSFQQELAAVGALHDLVELVCDKLVTVHLMHLSLVLFAHSALPP